jgi:hypothetical protein
MKNILKYPILSEGKARKCSTFRESHFCHKINNYMAFYARITE